MFLYAVMRVDLRFWIPNGAKGPGSYAMCSGAASLGSVAEESMEIATEKEGQRPDASRLRAGEQV